MIDVLKKEAKESTSKQMLDLIDDTLRLLKKERKKRNDRALFDLPQKGNAIIIGDLHGDFDSLYFILKNSKFPRDRDYLVCLGDYVDRGENSPEILYTVLSLKKSFPENVVLLRGNHEPPKDLIPSPHDLPYRLQKYGNDGLKIYSKLFSLFEYLDIAAMVEGKYLMLHGGLPVEISSIEDIAFAHKFHPEKSYLEEILWNDPEEIYGWEYSPRGAGKIFGQDITEKILNRIGVKTLIRSHQPPKEGVAVNHKGRILTISSTKVYGGKAAYLKLNLEEDAKDAYELSKIAKVF